ncbi:MAG: extracellular solute-binding protein, partial [Planctomycetales bacterium]|nr:extracellular solute-binding protein [Planctomycetales bacterium]
DGQGDPVGSTMTLSLYLFLTAFKDLRMGEASAVAWLLFLVTAATTALLFRGSRRWVHHQGVRTGSLVAVAIFAASGCGAPATTSTASNDEPVAAQREMVRFWHFWGGRDRPIVERIVAQFNRSQSAYHVRAVAMPGSNLDLKFFLAIAGGSPPDLLNHDDPVVADWAFRGMLTPLRDLTSRDEYQRLEQWLLPAARKLGTARGELFALTNGLDIRALYCNESWLEEVGLKPPTTLDELDRIATTLAPPGANEPYRRMGYLPDPRRLWAWGAVFGGAFGDATSDDPQHMIACDDPRVVAALEWMASYRRRYGAAQVAAFRSGEQALAGAAFPLLADRRYAVVMDGQWRVRDIAAASEADRRAGRPSDKFCAVPLPGPDGKASDAGWVNGNFFVVPRGAATPQGAWEFMKFWVGFEADANSAAEACAAGGWIPPSQQIIDHPAYQAELARQPLLKVFVDLAASPRQLPVPAIPSAAYYYREVNDAAARTLYTDDGDDPHRELETAATRARRRVRETLGVGE